MQTTHNQTTVQRNIRIISKTHKNHQKQTRKRFFHLSHCFTWNLSRTKHIKSRNQIQPTPKKRTWNSKHSLKTKNLLQRNLPKHNNQVKESSAPSHTIYIKKQNSKYSITTIALQLMRQTKKKESFSHLTDIFPKLKSPKSKKKYQDLRITHFHKSSTSKESNIK